MCRIYGYLGKRTFDKKSLGKVAARQLNGGPDEQDMVIKNEWALGNNRLAIQGIDGGRQPFHLDGIYCVFNGEIYNHNQLRYDLQQKGFLFNDTCDGSIIPALYQIYGRDFVKKLDGMFAIAIVDTVNFEENQLFLLSDPSGIKSVYYTFDEQKTTIAFASEIMALTEFKLSSNEIRTEAINEYLSGRTVWGSNTIFSKIKQLEPASILTFSRKQRLCIETFESEIDKNIESYNLEEAGIELDLALQKEIEQMLCADVQPCIVTSGGLDSSYLTALASKFAPKIHSFNIAYAGKWPFDERGYAKRIAEQYNAQYHQIEIQESDFPFLLEKMITHLGQPNTAPHCISTYALFEAIKKYGFKFALTGEGADEMFGGYKRFASATFDTSSSWQNNYLDKLSAVKMPIRWKSYTEAYKQVLTNYDAHHNRCKAILNELEEKHGKLDALLRFDQEYRFPYYILRRVDHLSMANSIEVRVPFCQPKIKALSRKLPLEQKLDNTSVKKILYAAAKDKIDSRILDRPKQPFTLPITAMLQGKHPLMKIAKDTLFSKTFINRGVFNKNYIKHLFELQSRNPNDIAAGTIWSLMVLELWMQYYNIDFKLA